MRLKSLSIHLQTTTKKKFFLLVFVIHYNFLYLFFCTALFKRFCTLKKNWETINKSFAQTKYFWKFKVCHSPINFLLFFTSLLLPIFYGFGEFKSSNIFNIFCMRHFRFCIFGRFVYIKINANSTCSVSFNLQLEGWVFQPAVFFLIRLVELSVNIISSIERIFRD